MKKYALLLTLIILSFSILSFGQETNTGSKDKAKKDETPTIQIQPQTALVDEVISIRVTNLKPLQAVTIKATMIDRREREWISQASFTVSQTGEVDLNKQAPTKGSYSGVDPMGLFWSMDLTPNQPNKPSQQLKPLTKPTTTKFEVVADDKIVASANLIRHHLAKDVKAQEVRDNGLVGKFYAPTASGKLPCVLVLGGSEGGLQSAEVDAALLASHGYAAFALAYFGAEDLPKALDQIPIEYLKKGIDWMAAKDGVDRARLAVMGSSKGAELGLLLASMFPELKAVIAVAPSSVVWEGIGDMGPGTGSSWTYQNKQIPFAKPVITDEFMKQDFSKAINVGLIYKEGLKNKEAVEKSVIQVEKINGSILLVSGKDDQLWQSSLMSEMIVERLKQHKHKFRYEHLSYESAGHGIRRPYFSTMRANSGKLLLGGTPQGDAQAQADSWLKILKFLAENLRPSGRQ